MSGIPEVAANAGKHHACVGGVLFDHLEKPRDSVLLGNGYLEDGINSEASQRPACVLHHTPKA